jgi:aminoglycoside 2'-N-acetyltransferase I
MNEPAPDISLAHTAHLDDVQLRAIQGLLTRAFRGRFSDEDYDHALGGMHACLWEDRDLVGHASVVMRRLLHGSRSLRVGYVEAVAVRADRRRLGYGSALMDALEPLIHGGYDLGALSASSAGETLYAGRGWFRWAGTTSVIAPTGRRRTPGEDGSVWVLPGSTVLDPAEDLACDWREGDVW